MFTQVEREDACIQKWIGGCPIHQTFSSYRNPTVAWYSFTPSKVEYSEELVCKSLIISIEIMERITNRRQPSKGLKLTKPFYLPQYHSFAYLVNSDKMTKTTRLRVMNASVIAEKQVNQLSDELVRVGDSLRDKNYREANKFYTLSRDLNKIVDKIEELQTEDD